VNGLKVLNSTEDRSVNFVENQLVGFLESRYVRKCREYFICYLSSQTGCNRGCTFCHLTATGQTSFTDSDHNDFLSQALQVFRHYRRERERDNAPADLVHFNFMARGEPLANWHFLDSADELLNKLGQLAIAERLPSKFNISTIMPTTFRRRSLRDVFRFITPTIYYSLYSVSEEFRKKWMPAAMPVGEALDMLKDYQEFSKKIVKIHFPFIKGVNDSLADVSRMCDEIDARELACEFNLVRYNPASPDQGEESPPEVLDARLAQITERFGGRKVQAIPRVGFDVQASCGMFVGPGTDEESP